MENSRRPESQHRGSASPAILGRPTEPSVTTDIPDINTARLRLVSLGIDFLRAAVAGDLPQLRTLVDFSICDPCSLIGRSWIDRRIQMIEEDPAPHPWMNRAIVRKEDNQMVGHINFHHKDPDPYLLEHVACGAELGYTTEEPFRRKGYATEIAVAMMKWAHHEHGVDTFILSISPGNEPSLRMAEAMNFR
jgi:ribosomal-protein-alanine N-acetyltransferase